MTTVVALGFIALTIACVTGLAWLALRDRLASHERRLRDLERRV